MSSFTPELGQSAFSNGSMQSLDLDGLLEDGLCVIAQAIATVRGDAYGTLVSNSGGDEFVSDTFSMRAYCWCDGDREGHEDECPPNFAHHPSGLAVSWYKHVGRGGSQNRSVDGREWFRILRDCLAEVLDNPDAEGI